MAQSRKAIKLRIKSIRNTRKITKAMELVAASKMRRAVASALKARPYAETSLLSIREALGALGEGVSHPLLLGNPKATKTLLILMSSDRGLAGGLNVNLARAAVTAVREIGKDDVEVLAIGKRGGDALERIGVKVIARFSALSNNPTFNDLLPAARLALDAYNRGEYKAIMLGYTDFISGISQKPKIYKLLPFELEGEGQTERKFEPSPSAVLERVLPTLAKTMLWQALLESGASEHAARMLAMKNASDAAKDMLSSLTFTYNQARQASITQEIAEISSGKAALE
jgi:F-type H+-transporting ATPase subunit gamma